MKGLVFTEFSEMVEDRFGLAVCDAVVSESSSGGAFTAVGDYDHRELLGMVAALSRETGTPAAELVESFGCHLFHRFTTQFPALFEGVGGPLELLEHVQDHVHMQVRRIHPDATFPSFETKREGDTLHMRYSSPRCLSDLARGLIRGCLEHYETPGTVETVRETEDGSVVRFTVRIDD